MSYRRIRHECIFSRIYWYCYSNPFGGGVCANVNLKRSAGQDSDWIVIAAGWGLAVSMGAYAVGKFSGAHLNPAVSIALAMDGSFSWAKYLAILSVKCLEVSLAVY